MKQKIKELKHAIYYDNRFGRNDGPPLYYFNVMKAKLKWDVIHLIPIGDTQKEFGKFDFHWWIDWGEDSLMPFYQEWYPPKDGGKTIYVASDAHIDKGYRFEKARKFDYVFFNQKRALKEFKKLYPNKKNVYWLPHAAEPQAYPHFEILKKFDVGFIGHVQETENEYFYNLTRVDVLDRIFKEFPNFYFGTRNSSNPSINMFEDASKKFCQSRIVFNYSIKDDINMRLFETLSSGSFLLTNYLDTIPALYEDGKHLVMYKDLDDAVEKIKYYLEHDKEREKIAKAGHKLFMQRDTYQNRIKTIKKTIGF